MIFESVLKQLHWHLNVITFNYKKNVEFVIRNKRICLFLFIPLSFWTGVMITSLFKATGDKS